MEELTTIQSKIYEIRGQRVMLDFDLAALYQVTTSALNQAVKRNIERFPEEFMFRISEIEWKNMSSQFVTTSQSEAAEDIPTLYFYRTGSCDAFCGIAQWNGNTSKYLYYESICRHAQLYYDSYNRYFGIG